MAKWANPSEETLKLVNDVLVNTIPERLGVSVKIIVNDDQKELGKLKKLTPDVKFAMGDELMIIINEEILEQLPPIEQNLYIQELLCGVYYDTELDRLVINQPDVKTFSGFLQKHTYEKYERMVESIKSLFDKKKENEENN